MQLTGAREVHEKVDLALVYDHYHYGFIAVDDVR